MQTRNIRQISAQPRRRSPHAAAQKIAGYYEFASPRNERFRFITDLLAGQRVFAHGGAIYQQPILGLGSKLVPAGTNQFRTKKQPDASVIFTTDPDGHQVMSIIASPLLDIPASYRKANPIWPVMRLLLYLGAVLTAASTIPFAIIWIPRWLFGRLRKEPHLDVRVVPMLAAIAGGATSALLYNAPALQLETRNFRTIGFAIGTVIFAALSALSLFVVIRALPSRMHRAIRIYSAMTAVALFGLTIFLARWGMIGFRFWAW